MPVRVARLLLGDGDGLSLVAGDDSAAVLVSQLARVMQLGSRADGACPQSAPTPHRVFVCVDEDGAGAGALPVYLRLAIERQGAIGVGSVAPLWIAPSLGSAFDLGDATVCVVRPAPDAEALAVRMMWVAAVIGRCLERRGGVMLHAALMAWQGRGVVLAGPSGCGKSTASGRLPAPWRSLSDDLALVVPGPHGTPRAHPWPTWSRFLWGGAGGSWDVQQAVPLAGLFFVARSATDGMEAIGPGRAAALLAMQGAVPLDQHATTRVAREACCVRFANLCSIAKAVPAYILRLSLHGDFWCHLERALV